MSRLLASYERGRAIIHIPPSFGGRRMVYDSTDGARRGIDMTGERFATLLVLKRCGSDRRGRVTWTVECDCGFVTYGLSGQTLRQGRAKPCERCGR